MNKIIMNDTKISAPDAHFRKSMSISDAREQKRKPKPGKISELCMNDTFLNI